MREICFPEPSFLLTWCHGLNIKCCPRLMCCTFHPQLVALFWEVPETLGDGPSWRDWVTGGAP
jgi:hypothetical protein